MGKLFSLGPKFAILVPLIGELTQCYNLCGGVGRKRKAELVHPGRDCCKCSYCGRLDADQRFVNPQSRDEECILWLECSLTSLVKQYVSLEKGSQKSDRSEQKI